jgi:signal transduction histidine kinase
VGGPEHGVLSMPLALRQREVEATVDDLDRTIRLASVLFLALAAGIALSMARRISGPIQELTRATRRIAQGDLEARVEATSQDELRRLVEAFNQMARDLHAQRRDLERSNRLAAWADMARQVAHEVKNPLTPIQLSAEHLRRVFADRSEDFAQTLETCTDTILKQVRTLRGIVTEFSAVRASARGRALRPGSRAMLEEVIRPYQAGLPPRVGSEAGPRRARARRARGPPPARARVVNLLENALQAVGEPGPSASACGRATRAAGGDRGARLGPGRGPGGPGPHLRAVLLDQDERQRPRAGLVKKIAEDHGGGVSLESTPASRRGASCGCPRRTPTDRGVAPGASSAATASGRGSRESDDGASRKILLPLRCRTRTRKWSSGCRPILFIPCL